MNNRELTYQQILDKVEKLEQENNELKLYTQRYEKNIEKFKNGTGIYGQQDIGQILEFN